MRKKLKINEGTVRGFFIYYDTVSWCNDFAGLLDYSERFLVYSGGILALTNILLECKMYSTHRIGGWEGTSSCHPLELFRQNFPNKEISARFERFIPNKELVVQVIVHDEHYMV